MSMKITSKKSNSKHTILIIDDEPDIRDLLEYNLNQNGYNTVTANDGLDAFLKLDPQISLILLDVMMPKVDGYEVCEKIRSNSQFSHIPIVFLTAKNTSEDEYEGLIRGADDYIVKPISIKNLLIRIRNLINKVSINNDKLFNHLSITLDSEKHIVKSDGKIVNLTKIEYKLLLVLLKSPGKVFKRKELLDRAWDANTIVNDRTVDVHIKKLRSKIEIKESIIKTVHGVGYYIEE